MQATENSASHRVVTREEGAGVSLEPSDLSGVRGKVPHVEQEGDVGDSEEGKRVPSIGVLAKCSRQCFCTKPLELHSPGSGVGLPPTYALYHQTTWFNLPEPLFPQF